MRHPIRKSHLNHKLIALAVASCFATGVAYANPTAPAVVSGSASILRSGNLLQITNSPNAIINWGSFSIGASEITRFIQQSQASAVLNRVVGQDPSSILGALQSNGRVFLINPNGILFGAGAQIDVAGLVASTLNLSNADFLAGKLKFTEVAGAGSIVNQGNITTPQGGNVYLVAPDLTNSGIITSPKGEVVLAAGKSVELVNPGTPNLRVEITAPDNAARNLGQIVADSGRVGIYAGTINHKGTIRADSVTVGENGQILLKATKSTTLEAGSVTSANGPSGGKIEIRSGDTTLVAGTVEAKGSLVPAGGEGGGEGGTIHLLGNLVGLTGNARIDASGQTGGGTVLVGGDYQGKPGLSAVESNPIQNAFRTYVGPNATIAADAVTSGDGGKVIVWSDDATRAYGSISARGGAQSGNGGFVEVSGKRWLDFNASVDIRAPYGTTGVLLLDPNNVEIRTDVASGEGSFSGGNPNIFGGGSTTSQILWDTIKTNLASAAVYITTSGTGTAPGDITVVHNSPDLATPNTLRLIAHRDITVNGAISNTNVSGTSALEMYAGWDGTSSVLAPVVSNSGNLTINQPVTTGSGSIVLKATTAVNVNNTVSADGAFGNASVQLGATNGGIAIQNGVTIHAASLGDASITLSAIEGGISLGSAILSASGGSALGTGNDGSISLSATGGSISLGGARLSATGGDSNAVTGGAASISLSSSGGVSSTSSSLLGVSAVGGNSTSGVGGNATITVESAGAIDLTGMPLAATGGTGTSAGTATATVKVASTLGNNSPSGDITAHNITATGGNVELQQNSVAEKSIKRASGTSLITANQLLMEVDRPDNGPVGGSIGTSAEPMRVQVSKLEAHTHEAVSPGGGIFVESPNAGNLQIGGVSFFSGVVKGVQNVTSGDISIAVNGTLTTQTPGTAVPPCGGPGGPVCTASGNITLSANDMSIGHNVNAGTGTVTLTPFSTTRNVVIETPTSTTSGVLSLNTSELQQVTAGTLEIGRSTDTGTLTVATALDSSNVNASTLKLAHQNIAINQPITFSTGNENLTLAAGASGAVSLAADLNVGTGVIDASTSTVNFSGTRAITSTNSGTGFSAGTLNVDSTDSVSLNATSSANTLNLSGGTLGGSGNVTVSGPFNWTRGVLSGSGVKTVSGVLNIDPAPLAHFDVQLNGTTLVHTNASGFSHWNGRADWRIINGATFENSGVFEFQGLDPSIGRSIIGGGATSVFRNTATGTLIKSGPTWASIGFGGSERVRFENAGAINVNSNALFVNSDSIWTGATGSISIGNGATLCMCGGTNDLGATGVSGQGTFQVGTNPGFSDALGTTTSSGVFTPGTLSVSSGIVNINGTGASGSVNIGTASITGGTTSFNNSQPATFGALTLTGGTLSVGTGALASAGNLAMSGGTLAGAGQLSLTGSASSWSGGALSGNLRVAPGSTLALNGGMKNLRVGGSLTNEGNVVWSAGTISGASGGASGSSTITNASGGVFDIQGDVTVTDLDGGPALSTNTLTFVNQTGGELRRSVGTGTVVLGGATNDNVLAFNLQNNGTVNVATGTVLFQNGGFASGTNNGSIVIGSGATLSTNGAALTNAATGTIRGSGTVNLTSATLTNDGTIAPGGSIGTLSITGNLTQGSSGAIDVELAGSSAGQYDVLAVSGSAALNGTLNVSYLGGYEPAVGVNHPVMTYASRSGTFATINDALAQTVNYGATSFTLTGTGATANSVFWDGGAGDFLWTSALNWSADTLPVSTKNVTIGALGSPVTLSSGAQSINSLLSDANLIVSGGSLTIANASTINAGLTVSGGTVNANGGLNANSVNLSSGALQGLGNIAVSGPFAWSGGTVSGSGSNTFTTSGTSSLTGGTKTLTSRIWNNAGTATWTGGSINLSDAGAVVNNQGTFTANLASFSDDFLGIGTFNNLNGAVFNSNAGGFDVSFNGPAATNAGTINVSNGRFNFVQAFTNTGTINLTGAGAVFEAFTGSTANLNAGTSFTGTGEVRVVNGGTLNVNTALTLPNTQTLSLQGGTLNVNAATTAGALNMTGGTLTGAGPLTVNSSFTQSGGTISGLSLLDITQASGNLTFGAPLSVQALNAQASAGSINVNSPITAAGNMTLTASGALSDIDISASGGISTTGTRTATLNAGRDIVLRGAISAASGSLGLTLNPANSVRTPSGATLTLDGGTGGLTATVNNGKTWQNGGTITLQGASTIRLPNVGGYATFGNASGSVLNVNSTAGWSFTSDPSAQGGIVNNAGTININNNTGWEAAFTNAGTGTLNIAAGKFLSMQNGQSIAGTVDIGSGATLWVSERHGTNAAFNGTTVTGTGTLQVAAGIGPVADFTNVNAGAATLLVGSGGTVNLLSGTSTFGGLSVTGGTLSGSGNLMVNNSFSQTGGTQSGTGTTTLGPAVTSTLGGVTVGPRNLTNQGTLNLNGPTMTGALTNIGTLNVIGSTTAGGGLAQPSGVLNINGGQTFTIGGSGFDWQGGTLAGAGTLVLPAEASLNLPAGGTLSGTGTVNASVNNSAGTVAPGASPGILTINGNYTQGSSGVLEMQIGGATAGTQYDQLIVTGTATLGGTLNTTLINGFVPAAGNTFNVIQAGTVSGTFATTNLPSPLAPSYFATSVSLASTLSPPSPSLSPGDTALPLTVAAAINTNVTATNVVQQTTEPNQVTQDVQQAAITDIKEADKDALPLCR